MGSVVSTDIELVEASAAGQIEAFASLVEQYQSLVCAVSYSATGDRALSEDVAQETFVAAWNGISELREPSKLRGWLCGIARNLSSKALRRVRREVPGDVETQAAIDDDRTAPSPLDEALDNESDRLVWEALERIPEAYREPLVLFYREDQSTRQVADALGLSENAVQQRLSRGRQHLKANVADLVERTLERTKPSKGFVAGVVAVIASGASGTAKAAAADALASRASAGGPVAPAKGPLPMNTLKLFLVALAMVAAVFGVASLFGQAPEPTGSQPHATEPGNLAPAPAAPAPELPSAGPASDRSLASSSALATPAAAGPGTARAEQAGVLFEISFVDDAGEPSEALRDAAMPEIGETLDVLAGCFGAFAERNPDLRGNAGRVSVDVNVARDESLGGIAVGTDFRASAGTVVDADFGECMRESSFALTYDAERGGVAPGTARIVMALPDASPARRHQQADVQDCFEDLQRRRPGVSLAGTINDAAFAECMDRAVGATDLPDAPDGAAFVPESDPRVQACYAEGRRRKPRASVDDLFEDEGVKRCLQRIAPPR